MSIVAADPARSPSRLSGPIYLLGYCLFSALKAVLIANLVQGMDPFLLVFVSFFLTAAFFCAIEHRLFRRPLWAPPIFADILWLNASNALCWLSFYFALTYIDAATVGAVALGVGPFLTAFLSHVFRPGIPATRREKIAGVGIFLSMGFLVYVSWRGQGAVTVAPFAALVGMFFTVLTGLGVAGNTVFSKRLADRGFRAAELMALRFFLLIALSGIAVLLRASDWTPVFNQTFAVLFVSALAVLPLYLLQRGIVLSEPMVVALLTPLAPVIAFCLQHFDPRLHFSLPSLIGVAGVTAFALGGVSLKRPSG